MSFTSSSIIKKHLLTSTFPAQEIRNHPVTFADGDVIALPHHNLVAESDVVKQDTLNVPYMDSSATLKGEDFSTLEHEQLVPGTVVVTYSEALTTVLAEEVDYQVDYVAGQVRRLASGEIPDMQPVMVYYSYFQVFTRDTDYSIDNVNGVLTRAGDGAIVAGAAVLVDYTVTVGTVEDDLIGEAIAEAEDLIVRSLAPEYSANSTDQGLTTGATELALSMICRALGIEALSRRATTDVPGRAKEWQQLSRTYEQQAWQTLAPFLLPMSLRSTIRTSRQSDN